MATLSSLLSELSASTGGSPTFFRVYNTSYNSVSNGGCCCLWTVPSGVLSVTFELYGGGASGNDGCCCNYQNYGGANGTIAKVTLDTVAGCQYQICAAGSNACAYEISNTGCNGCSSWVCNVSAGSVVACACGGEQGTSQPGHSSPFNAYSCCWAPISGNNNTSKRSSINDANGYSFQGVKGSAPRNTYCHTDEWYHTSGGMGTGEGRSYDLCTTTMYGNGRNRHNGDRSVGNFPGGAGYSAYACAGVHEYGTFGAGGLIVVKYG